MQVRMKQTPMMSQALINMIKNDQEVIVNQSDVQEAVPSMFMPYFEGPKMNWNVSDGLYHRFF